ncbi:MAG: LXG domain-containing protein, partial [Lactobacillaceae bacterium]|nr:LXG domain-containing protein [Lactobacillaceae bacterium]
MSVTEVFADSWQEQSVGLQKGLQKRTEVLSELQQGFEVLSKTNHIKGRGADNMKAYISEVHMSLIHVLLTTVETFQNAIGVYWGGYDQIDSSGNFRLVNDELEQHVSNLKQGVVSTGEVALKIEKITNSVSDIMSFEFAGADRIREIQTSLDSMQQIAQNQKQNWEDYENSDHGFDQVDKLISQIEYYLPRLGQVTVGQGRGYQPGSFGTTLQKLSTTVSAAEKYNEKKSKVANRT